MKGDSEMFPRWLRSWHWFNAVCFLLLLVTGFSFHFSGVLSGVSLRWAVRIHNLSGVVLVAAYLLFVVVFFRKGHWRQYLPETSVRPYLVQTRWYLQGILRGDHHPFPATTEARFNPLQKISYFFVVFLAYPVQAITGVFLLFPASAPSKVAGFGGIWPMAVTHTLVAYSLVVFSIIHVYLALTVAEPHTGVRAMLYGDAPPVPAPPAPEEPPPAPEEPPPPAAVVVTDKPKG